MPSTKARNRIAGRRRHGEVTGAALRTRVIRHRVMRTHDRSAPPPRSTTTHRSRLTPDPRAILEEAAGAILAALLIYFGAVLLGYVGTPAVGSLMVILGVLTVIAGTTLAQTRQQLAVAFGGGLLLAIVGGLMDPVAGHVLAKASAIIAMYAVVVLVFAFQSILGRRRRSSDDSAPEPAGRTRDVDVPKPG